MSWDSTVSKIWLPTTCCGQDSVPLLRKRSRALPWPRPDRPSSIANHKWSVLYGVYPSPSRYAETCTCTNQGSSSTNLTQSTPFTDSYSLLHSTTPHSYTMSHLPQYLSQRSYMPSSAYESWITSLLYSTRALPTPARTFAVRSSNSYTLSGIGRCCRRIRVIFAVFRRALFYLICRGWCIFGIRWYWCLLVWECRAYKRWRWCERHENRICRRFSYPVGCRISQCCRYSKIGLFYLLTAVSFRRRLGWTFHNPQPNIYDNPPPNWPLSSHFSSR